MRIYTIRYKSLTNADKLTGGEVSLAHHVTRRQKI